MAVVHGEARARTSISESIAPSLMRELCSFQDEGVAGVSTPSCQAEMLSPGARPLPCARPHAYVPSLTPFPRAPLSFPPQVYEGGSSVDQFVARFLLKETASQTQSLLSSVESAVEAIEEQTSQIRCVPGASRGHAGLCPTHAHSSLLLAGASGALGTGRPWCCASLSGGDGYTPATSGPVRTEGDRVRRGVPGVCVTRAHGAYARGVETVS